MSIFWNHSSCLAVLASSLALGFAPSAVADPQKVYQKAVPSVMTLEVENLAGERFTGGAVLALRNDVAVTAWHVVSDARAAWATFSDGTKIHVLGCIDKDAGRDLALLRLARPMPGHRAPLVQSLQAVATRAYAIGASKGYGFSISDGLVSQVRSVGGIEQYQVSCPISPGSSGGPVLNERGQVIGIVLWTKSDAQNVSFAIPSREVFRLNLNAPLTRWDQLAFREEPTLTPRLTHSDLTLTPPVAGADEPGLAQWLGKYAGKRATVVISENGREDRLTFTVPPKISR